MASTRRSRTLALFVCVQLVLLAALGVSFARHPSATAQQLRMAATGQASPTPLVLERDVPLRISPRYDDPELVNDVELADVLRQVQPRFSAQKIKPNYVEHALRIWSIDAEFRDPRILSGRQMVDFLVNHGKYLASWGAEMKPLLEEKESGISIRYGREEGASVHHDHFLACLTEAGIPLHQPIYTPSHREKSFNDVFQQALLDFRVDERETEWSVLAYGLWLPPRGQWTNNQGRQITFDLLAERLMRASLDQGTCHGTHRLYSLMVLVRLNDEFHGQLIQPETRATIMAHLGRVRDIIKQSQFPDGHWASHWPQGADSLKNTAVDEEFRQVIATGHHLEWLAIAPPELHPPREQLRKAARWLITTTRRQSHAEILAKYTFFSHVGNALALWRKTTPPEFWKQWEATHPEEGRDIPTVVPAATPTASPTESVSTPVEH